MDDLPGVWLPPRELLRCRCDGSARTREPAVERRPEPCIGRVKTDSHGDQRRFRRRRHIVAANCTSEAFLGAEGVSARGRNPGTMRIWCANSATSTAWDTRARLMRRRWSAGLSSLSRLVVVVSRSP
jgi:hypothetical protein